MKRPRWRLRESTAASTEPALQRAGAGSGGQTMDNDGDQDNDGVLKDCPNCEYGMTSDGEVCPTCKGAGKLMRESGEPVLSLREGVNLDSLPGFGHAKKSEQLEQLVAAMTVRLREAGPEKVSSTFAPFGTGTGDSYEVVLIREGKGNSEDGRWYTRQAVQELVGSGVCEGMQAYSNHPTLDEEEFLPERSIRDLVGSYRNVRFAESESGLAEARATFVPIKGDGYEWVTTLAENAIANSGEKPLIGISLYGAAAGEDRTRPDGSFGPVADLVRPTSGDIVTNAGAGGQFVKRLMESARAKRDANHPPSKEHDTMQLTQLMSKIKESAARLREADTDEKRTAALDELDTLAKAEVEHDPNDIKVDDLKVETLKESQPLWGRIREAFTPEIEAAGKASGNEDAAALKAENARLQQELTDKESKLKESER
jgi:hypothetical protein